MEPTENQPDIGEVPAKWVEGLAGYPSRVVSLDRYGPPTAVEIGSELQQLRHVEPPFEGLTSGALEQSRTAGHHGGGAVDPQPRALVQRENRTVVLLEELLDPLLPGLSHERRVRVGVDVVQVDLERQQVQRVEARRLADRHVVGRAYRRTGDGGPGRCTHVTRCTLAHVFAQTVDDFEAVEGVEQTERVTATHHHGVGVENGTGGIGGVMGGDDLDAECPERGRDSLGVVVPVGQRERDERHCLPRRDLDERRGGVTEHRGAVVHRIGKQQEIHRVRQPADSSTKMRMSRPVMRCWYLS